MTIPPAAGTGSGVGASGGVQPGQPQQQQQPTMPAYDPTSALASINHKIALLEEQTQGFVEINARTADEARRRVRGVPTEELEGQYIDLVRPLLCFRCYPLVELACSRSISHSSFKK